MTSKLKLDENLSRHLAPTLRHYGYDAVTVAEEGLLSQSDVVVAAAAKEEERILLTLDLEFADLRKYPPGSHPGIILFRPKTFGPLSVNHFIEEFIKTANLSDLLDSVVVVEPLKIRIRRP